MQRLRLSENSLVFDNYLAYDCKLMFRAKTAAASCLPLRMNEATILSVRSATEPNDIDSLVKRPGFLSPCNLIV